MSVLHDLRIHPICVQPGKLVFPKAGISSISLEVYGDREVHDFALEHSNVMSNPEGDHRQLHGKLSNTSFATKIFGQPPCKGNCHLLCAAAWSLCGISRSWTDRTSLECELTAPTSLHLSLTRPVGGHSSHGSSRCHGGALQPQLG